MSRVGASNDDKSTSLITPFVAECISARWEAYNQCALGSVWRNAPDWVFRSVHFAPIHNGSSLTEAAAHSGSKHCADLCRPVRTCKPTTVATVNAVSLTQPMNRPKQFGSEISRSPSDNFPPEE